MQVNDLTRKNQRVDTKPNSHFLLLLQDIIRYVEAPYLYARGLIGVASLAIAMHG